VLGGLGGLCVLCAKAFTRFYTLLTESLRLRCRLPGRVAPNEQTQHIHKIRRTYSMLRYKTLALLIFAAGCTSPIGPGEELARAQSKWLKGAPQSYVIKVGRICECTPQMVGPVNVSVRGQLVTRTYATSGEAVPAGIDKFFPTVPDLFHMVAILRENKPYKLDVQYDSTLGIPIVISVDYSRETVDDEVAIYVMEFHEQ